MTKRIYAILVVLLSCMVSGSSYAADACVMLSSNIKPYQQALSGFKKGFSGNVEIFILDRDVGKSSVMVQEIRENKCKVVLAFGSSALNFLKIRITNKPLLYAMVLNPFSIIGQQKNIAGVHLEVSPTAALSAIHKIFPNATRIGLLYNPSLNKKTVQIANRAASQKGLELMATPVDSIGSAISATKLLASRCDVLWMIPDAMTSSRKVFEEMLEVSFRSGIPLFALSRKHVSEGAIAALNADYRHNGLQAGRMAERIVAGASPSSIGDEYAARYGLVLNLGTAKQLGFEIPKSIVSEAVEVY